MPKKDRKCQFCKRKAVALVEKLLQGKPFPVCRECLVDTRKYPQYVTVVYWGQTEARREP